MHGEFVAGDVTKNTRYRHAFAMLTPDAIELANLILALARQNQAQNAATGPSTVQ
jgi:hypothetical protein